MSPKPTSSRQIPRQSLPALAQEYQPQVLAADIPVFFPPSGMHREKPPSMLGLNEAYTAKNLVIRRGQYKVRDGIATMGSGVFARPVLGLTVFARTQGSEALTAFTDQGVYRLVGGSFNALTGAVLTTQEFDRYSFAAWNNKLLFSNGRDPISEVDYSARSYSELGEAPVAKFIVTLGGRIIAGYVGDNPVRVQWNVKNNSEDWTGLGSGYEDMLASPGGAIDQIQGLFVVNNNFVLVVRTRSVWAIQETGLYDAPYSFSKLWDLPATNSPWSFAYTPMGVIGLCRDDIYVFSEQQAPQRIGTSVIDTVTGDIDRAHGCYDAHNREYVLNVPQDSGTKLWRFSLDAQAWTTSEYHFRSVTCTPGNYRTVLQIGQLTGTIQNLEGPLETLGVSDSTTQGLIFCTGIAAEWVVHESSSATTDVTPSNAAVTVAFGFELTSGMWMGQPQLKAVEVIETVLHYTSTRAITITTGLSVDLATTTTSMGSVATEVTTVPKVCRITGPLARQYAVLKLSSADAAGLCLINFIARGYEGGKIAY